MVEADLSKSGVEGVASVTILAELAFVNVFVAGDALSFVQKVRLGLLPWR